ncbi:hypothetical protein V492_06277 [Pseudogymnoascus sp. VKM F-4246]|nr:hypothetical protein V492_06277 [Pseudogymnoascus sp. VKM F-4246]
MAPKKGGGSSSGGSSGDYSGGDDEYDYNTGSGSGDDDYNYNTGSGSSDDDYNYGSGTSSGSGSSSGSGDSDYNYDSGSGSGSGSSNDDYDYNYGDDDNDFDYDFDSGGSDGFDGPHGGSYHGWKDAATNALFATNIIALLVLILCMILTRRFKWIREKGTDKLRNSGYLIATFCMFLHFLVKVVGTGILESGVQTDQNFLIAYVFERLFSLIGDVLIVAIITRTLLEDLSCGSGLLALFSNGLVGCLWVFAIISFSLYAAFQGQGISGDGYTEAVLDGQKYTSVIYSAFIFGISMYLTILAFVAVVKRRSKGTFLMILFVIPSLFLRSLVALIADSIMNFQLRSTSAASIDTANSFVYTFTTLSIFLVVALIGGLRQRHSEGGISQEQKIGLSNHQYVPLGPYVQTPAPYGSQAPVEQYPQQAPPVQYGAPGQPVLQIQQVPVSYATPVHPVPYAPSGQYGDLGQRSLSPSHGSIDLSAHTAYTGTTSSVSPPPQHDPYQLHMPPKH